MNGGNQRKHIGNSLVVQWLGLCAFTVEGPGSVPGQGNKILQATQCGQKQKQNKTKTHIRKHIPCQSFKWIWLTYILPYGEQRNAQECPQPIPRFAHNVPHIPAHISLDPHLWFWILIRLHWVPYHVLPLSPCTTHWPSSVRSERDLNKLEGAHSPKLFHYG